MRLPSTPSFIALTFALSIALPACGSSDNKSVDKTSPEAGPGDGLGGSTSTGGSTGTGGGSSGGSTGTGGSSSGGSSGGGNIEGPLSCNYVDDHNCTTFSSAPANAASADCLTGSTVVAACPTADLYATCTFATSGIQEEFFYYGAANFTMNNLKTACDAESGTLTFTK